MLILADDLTGAADCGAAFTRRGLSTTVVLDRGQVSRIIPVDVVSVDVDSRAMSVDAAVVATRAALTPYLAEITLGPSAGGRGVFVKIDSTVRGHVRATVETVLSTMLHRPSRVVVCPAFPALGRTVVDGCVHVDGEPLADGDLRALFSGFSTGAGLFVATAANDEQLAALVASMDDDVLWVGSAGLAHHVAGRLRPGRSRLPSARRAIADVADVVVVVGSQNERSITQLSRLPAATAVLRVDPRDRSQLDRLRPMIANAHGLVLTGGQTARAVLDMLGVDQIVIGGEVETGIPWGTAVIGGRSVPLVTKAGGFGDDASLCRAVEFLTSAPPY